MQFTYGCGFNQAVPEVLIPGTGEISLVQEDDAPPTIGVAGSAPGESGVFSRVEAFAYLLSLTGNTALVERETARRRVSHQGLVASALLRVSCFSCGGAGASSSG